MDSEEIENLNLKTELAKLRANRRNVTRESVFRRVNEKNELTSWDTFYQSKQKTLKNLQDELKDVNEDFRKKIHDMFKM